MAITGTFLADFSNFTAAVAKAEVSLKAFEGNANKVESALDRATNALGGVKIVQQATIAAEAVARLGGDAGIAGGLLKLTDAELRKLGSTAQEAAEKLRAMGKDVPTGIQNIADAARRADDATSKATTSTLTWQSALLKTASALGIAFSAQQLIAFTGRVFEAAGRISDLSKQLHVSTDAVQRWEYAIGLSGGTIEDVGNALSVLNRKLGEGDSSTIQALKDAGLEFHKIRALKPEEAFETVLTSVGSMTDAMKQASVQQELFGRGGKELLAAMSEGFVETGHKADIMSKETVARLEKAGDAWTKLGNKVTIVTGEFIAAIDKYLGRWKSASEQQYADKVFNTLHLNTKKAKEDLEDLQRLMGAIFGTKEEAPKVSAPKGFGAPTRIDMPVRTPAELDAEAAALDKIIGKQRDANKVIDEQAEALKRMAEARIPLKQSQLDQIDLWAKENQSVSDMAKALKVSEVQVRSYLDAQKALGKETEDAAARAEKAAKVQADLEQYIRNESVNLQRKQTAAIIAENEKVAKALGATQDKRLAALVDYEEKNYQATLKGSELRIRQIEIEHQKAINALGIRTDAEADLYDKAAAQIDKYWNDQAKKAKSSTDQLLKSVGDLSSALANLAQIAGGSFGAIAGGLATLVGSIDSAVKGAQALKAGMAAFKAADILSGIAGMASGIGGIVSAAAAAAQGIKALWSAFDRNKGRDLVEDFAKSFGGFDQLHDELLLLGQAGEELWIKLTQGVGRNNPEQAAKVIGEVEDALAKYKSSQDALNITTEAGAQATIETAAQAALALDEVNAKLLTNAEAWGVWSEDVTGYLQKLADDIRALPLPGPTGTMGGATLSAGARTSSFASSATSGSQRINVYLDGEVIAEKTVQHMVPELSLNGF